MGSKNCPETPRQKMIGMMYLVLTALLALNVSKDILNAFIVVNNATESTNKNFTTKIDETYEQLRKAAENDSIRVGEYYRKALLISKASDELVKYVETMKDTLFFIVDGIPVDEVRKQHKSLEDMSSKDNYDKPTTFFINNRRAYDMSKKFREYKAQLVKIYDDSTFTLDNNILTSSLQVDKKYIQDKMEVDWETATFNRTVAAATYTLLNKAINEIKNIEFETVNLLKSSIGAASFKFDEVVAKVIPNSRIVFAGDAYEADIIVAAFDSKLPISVYYGSGRDTATADHIGSLKEEVGIGVVKLKIPTSAVGDQKFAGFIRMKNPKGETVDYGFKSSYTVTKPAAAVAAEKMNVFYAGIPNPVAIAAPVAPERLRINWGGASATTTGPGKYDVNVPATLAGREITIEVSAEIDRKITPMGKTVFRIKKVPAPDVFIGAGITGGKQAKDIVLANPFLVAKMPPDFNYILPWTVVSYKVTFVKNGVEDAPITINGPQFSDQVKNKIQSATSGMIIEFSDIVIKSIAGQQNISKVYSIRIR